MSESEILGPKEKCLQPFSPGVQSGSSLFSHRLYKQSGKKGFRKTFLDALQSNRRYPRYLDVLVDDEIKLIESVGHVYDHMRDHWFGRDPSGCPFSPWFPNERNLELKLREGMIEFIEWANRVDPYEEKRLDSCWIVHPPATFVTLYFGDNRDALMLYRITPMPVKNPENQG